MKKTTAAVAGLGLLGLATSPVFAENNDTTAENSKVEFSDLSLVSGQPDDGTCKTRYTEGYTTTHKGKTDEGHTQLESHKGHDILVTESDGTVGEGIYTMTNSYEVVFPESEDKTPVEVTMFASGLIGESPIVGVFSDGTCRGHITIHDAQDKS
ncbi:hypothetical protein PsW64_02126 [Pseudovibrio sp. W64]|uniref:hypothetical protein n=1 Tax=unclassified Pseudovibrio TaxID=2627060 RepID=UPI0007AE6184|nr:MULTISPECIES: hypothetical protein [unclassified Pseudovibrio]KZK79929.1 hypothetical protein PsAD13_04919 [Pseudovibrio sp. Ad13]KZK83958.1 hypothetical protein PsW64_02126 [Pseudovibrio sp. W64]